MYIKHFHQHAAHPHGLYSSSTLTAHVVCVYLTAHTGTSRASPQDPLSGFVRGVGDAEEHKGGISVLPPDLPLMWA